MFMPFRISFRKTAAHSLSVPLRVMCAVCVGSTDRYIDVRNWCIYNVISESALVMNWSVGMAAIVFCAAIGILFGSYLAAKASRLQPIQALHAK